MNDRSSHRPLFCIGRDGLCAEICSLATDYGSVLLFGGRQCGKTTVLLKIAESLGDRQYDASEFIEADVPVYVDLMQLTPDAGPSDVFELLLALATAACRRQIRGVDGHAPPAPGSVKRLEDLVAGLARLIAGNGDVEVNFLFLFDEAKRVLGDRFSRGFQDNLFALLYGGHDISGRCRIVFAGAQDLYKLADDDTSPLASRAARKLVLNMTHGDVQEMMRAVHEEFDPAELERRGHLIHDNTGGQAGLTTMLSRRLARYDSLSEDNFRREVERLQLERKNLFEVWREALSPEARAVHDLVLTVDGPVDRTTMLRELERCGLDPARWDWARDELQFTGIARSERDGLCVSNRMYCEVARKGIGAAARSSVADLPVTDLLAAGESARIERKSSLRWDYRQNKKNEELEVVITQTIAAFQNTDGGCLLIGVDDSGKVLGLEQDFGTLTKKPDRDGFEQHLVNVVCRDLGKEACTRLEVQLHALDGGDVCVVRIEPSPKPVYVRAKDKSGKSVTQFWIRTGNTKQELTVEESIEYFASHWSDG